MNYLIIIEGPDEYAKSFKLIGDELELRGNQVTYCLVAESSKVLLKKLNYNLNNCLFFSAYFRNNYNSHNEKHNYYNTNWGSFLFSDIDRFFYWNINYDKTNEYWERYFYLINKFFYNTIKKLNIDIILYENVSNSFSYSAFQVSKLCNIKYIGLVSSRLPNRFEIHKTINNSSTILEKLYNESYASEATENEKKYIANYLNNFNNIEPDYMKFNGLSEVSIAKKYLNIKKLKKIFNLINVYIKFKQNFYWEFTRSNPIILSRNFLINSFFRYVRSKIIIKYFNTNFDVLTDQFYIYPIHFHPESSTSILAPNYTDEFNNILNISMALPIGEKLYVKDHKSAFGNQSLSFYKKVSALPNVKLILPNVNIKSLIKNSKGLITITGTAGFEALILKKPVFCFGNVFYDKFPGVKKITSFKELEKHLGLNSEVSINVDESRILLAYLRFTFPGKLNLLNIDNDVNKLKHICDAIELESLK